ncbi:MAG: hypothetical protein LBK66_09415 [Spirochaetaceae bacterium]|jgi:hypothetical protein|nr:hypothetical protein [Spirochaetaceae bacterium]
MAGLMAWFRHGLTAAGAVMGCIKKRRLCIIFLTIVFSVMTFPAAAQENDAELDETEEIEDIAIDDIGSIDGDIDESIDDGIDDDIEGGADDENAGIPIMSNWDGMPLTGYTRGDQTFNISLGVLLPLFFTSASGDTLENKLSVGGVGSLAYNYFLDSHIFLGGILAGSFSQTLGKNFLYMIPIAFTAGYQFVFRRFEFPLSLTVGGMTEQYLTYNGYWLFLKPQASGFFRFNNDWSFGLNVAWWLAPQWTNIPEKDAVGNFMEITLSARYHF